jgi:hypothetical protein
MSKQEPARAVIRRSPHINVGAITIPWFQPEPIEWESQLERSCIYAAIAFWPVVSVCARHAQARNQEGPAQVHKKCD